MCNRKTLLLKLLIATALLPGVKARAQTSLLERSQELEALVPAPAPFYASSAVGRPEPTSVLEVASTALDYGVADSVEPEDASEAPRLALSYLPRETLELSFEAPWVFSHTGTEKTRVGSGNATFGVSWRVLEHSHGLNLSISPEVDVYNPSLVMDRDVQDDVTEFLIPVEFEGHLGPVSFRPRLGVTIYEDENVEWNYELAVGYELQERLALKGEIHGASSRELDSADLAAFLGATFELRDQVALVLAAGGSVSDSSEGTPVAYLGLTLGF